MKYYYLAAALPDLQMGYPADLSFHEFDIMLRNNLLDPDYDAVRVIRRFYDIQNIRAFWNKEPIDPKGNMNEVQLEEALLTRMGLPEYVYTFIEKYDSQEERLRNFPELVVAYYQNEPKTGFLGNFLPFERDWRLVLTGFRAKKLGRDLAVELQFEDPHDEIVAQLLAQKDSKQYEPPTRYAHLKAVFDEHGDQALELHRALCEYRFDMVDTFYGVDVFSLDRILAYLVQLMLVEKWLELDRKAGIEVVDQLVKEVG